MIEVVIRQAASLLLRYPGPGWAETLRLVRDTAGGLPDGRCASLLRFCSDVAAVPPLELEARYVTTFDRSPRRTLHMTYYTDGDTRRRGASMAGLKGEYRRRGWRPPDDQLPDFLPVMLEFAARCPEAGERLLAGHRPGLELLRLALRDHRSPYERVMEAVCGTLPGPSVRDRRAALELARTGPPAEAVGLEGYGAHARPVPLGGRP
ncbi:nitrate reductase molybdenum cofactor assembly chaperone [Actinomadura graeca]|uniref:Nitrate reductase molybdenum cofactor assembly chaperone n=1 Tax=Actinomadura graeca TaxID=2750812 RepID=A0ABX8R388_9ACTN|nr:nitrate reductase molybdenum cofactor assembly chaperone [Actinomadura graeca]QXJ25514.1 nitrate reductase molybdenum cofactor assembly chaperone [Actinomadura graeca]